MILSKKTVTFSIILLLVIAVLGFFGYQSTTKFPKGTQIAGILVEGENEKEARAMLEEKINNWNTNEYIYAASENEEIMIPKSVFTFNIDASIEQLKNRMKSWFPLYKKSNIAQPLVVDVNFDSEEISNLPNYIDIQPTLVNASTIASELKESSVKLVYLSDYTQQFTSIATETVSIPTGTSHVIIDNVLKQINDINIAPESTFSFIEVIPEMKVENLDEINFIASQIYSLILQTNLIVLERHSQGTIPVYAEPGIEVAINPNVNKDLLLYNPNETAYNMTLERNGSELIVSILSNESVDTLDYQTKTTQEVNPRTVYRYSEEVGYGQSKVIDEGKPGIEVEVYRTEQGEETLISNDFYPPEPRIVLLPLSSGMLTGNDTNIGSIEGDNLISENPGLSQEENRGNNGSNIGKPPEKNVENPKISKSFYDFVMDYCENMAENGLDNEGQEDGSCPENLDNNELQLLRLVWTFYNQESEQEPGNEQIITDDDNGDVEEEEIYVK